MSSNPTPIKMPDYGPWAITSQGMSRAIERARAIVAHPKPYEARGYKVSDDGVAVIELIGELTKYPEWPDGTATTEVGDLLSQAIDDGEVRSVMLLFDSPGGTIRGTDDLARKVARLKQIKPIHGHVEDLCASAAYWIASQCVQLTASPSAFVGSIGCYNILVDSSAAADRLGLKHYLIRSGEFKGAVADGIPLDDDTLAEHQRVINDYHALFVSAVESGRSMARASVEAIADGRLHVASDAAQLGLIDSVEDFADALSASGLASGGVTVMAHASPGGVAMAEQVKAKSQDENDEKEGPKMAPATMAELKEGLPNSTAEFREKCHLAGLTLQQAQDMLDEEENKKEDAKAEDDAKPEDEAKALAEQIASLKAEIALIKASAKATKGGDGVSERVLADPDEGADVRDRIDRKVADRMKAANAPRHEAFAWVMRSDPDLRQAYQDQVNESNGAARA